MTGLPGFGLGASWGPIPGRIEGATFRLASTNPELITLDDHLVAKKTPIIGNDLHADTNKSDQVPRPPSRASLNPVRIHSATNIRRVSIRVQHHKECLEFNGRNSRILANNFKSNKADGKDFARHNRPKTHLFFVKQPNDDCESFMVDVRSVNPQQADHPDLDSNNDSRVKNSVLECQRTAGNEIGLTDHVMTQAYYKTELKNAKGGERKNGWHRPYLVWRRPSMADRWHTSENWNGGPPPNQKMILLEKTDAGQKRGENRNLEILQPRIQLSMPPIGN
ncbi:unnamed protein product [Protopolystoma xenopodis]|uniref:Uncharacterized protein n=1 Tax=Protopolystoma xenopodis TaxID=117903 RepID=A0A3S5B6W1_9PLAT|nr:unnamed protein product [Protopolystoma xenopodis]